MTTGFGFRFTKHLSSPLTLPENWVCLLVGVEPIDTTKPKIGRRKDLLLLAARKGTRGIFTAKLGKF